MSVNPTTGTNYHDLGTPSQEEMQQTLVNLGEHLMRARAILTEGCQRPDALETIRIIAQSLCDLNPE